ncbi:ATP-binding protein [Asticcacaulis sp. BYS171W]|uniref:histidine kinase n=1 Tax=Asticcacaulis aquaticus TaxID=2984212 RepID=A0ABT5HS13_9CAUL|nr:ATP-binding protein [Asticcacaulis aquaticus]MDC7682732.1 ATP-binding protein [Asticcacaulis aquaticus]
MNGFHDIAASRVRGFTERLVLAAFVCGTALLLHWSVWPPLWLIIYTVSQTADKRLFSEWAAQPDRTPDRAQEIRLIVSVAVSVIIFSSMAAYTWFLGGTVGRLFAVVAISGALLHVSLQMYQKRRFLYAAVGPHALYLLALPTISAFTEGREGLMLLTLNIGTLVFLANLALAVRQSHRAMIEVTEARRTAEQASAAKSNFLAVMTHEIRTPMNAVVSAAHLLKRTDLTSEQTEHVTMLGEASDVLLGLVNDVLDISKIEAGKMTIERATLDLPDMVDGLTRIWRPQIEQKSLRLEVNIAPDLSRHIQTDPLRLRQILFNLLSNAVKFTAHGTIRLSVVQHDGILCFEVADQGIGIAPALKDRIFSSFEQAEAATTRRYGGTGLGLPISRQLARLMGGDIELCSIPHVGSAFTLSLPYLPVRTAPVEEVPMSASPTDTPRARRVLIVDDHEVNRRIVSLFIKPMGFDAVMAVNGAEAVEAARVETFDAILMDMQMPVMGGIDATAAIRAEAGPNQTTPIIALTANALDGHKKAWEAVGVYDFLTKPIDPDLLIDTLMARVNAAETDARKTA